MCGIIGICGHKPVAERLIAGLQRLEYRGYDSAGIAVITDQGLQRLRAAGKLDNLRQNYTSTPIEGHAGIGHTRWATHGGAEEHNAHPHGTSAVTLVHNGIIENFHELKATLPDVTWSSETDTEVVVHLLEAELKAGAEPKTAMIRVLPKLAGAFALVVCFRDWPETLIAARQGSPLAIGQQDGESFIGSDAVALSGLTEQICYLENGDWAVLTPDAIQIFDDSNKAVCRDFVPNTVQIAALGKGNYPHAMLKEIHEQPGVIGDTLHSLIDPKTLMINWSDYPKSQYLRTPLIQFTACGTAYYATLVAGYWFEQLCRIPVRHEMASEMRYRDIVCPQNSLGIFVSQSGETMDTMEAMRHWHEIGGQSTAIVNVPSSSLAREAHHTISTLAGPEIGVASTKAFTTQLTALYCLAIWMAEQTQCISPQQAQNRVADLLDLSGKLVQTLGLSEDYKTIAREMLAPASGVFFLGRGLNYPIALEGALKLKEITYMHAEGYPAGEMKHGPIALVSPELPVIVIAPSDRWFGKTFSNIQEVAARGGNLIMLTDAAGAQTIQAHDLQERVRCITLPDVPESLSPILYSLPVQMLAYETALCLGRNIDQPRNLAKSVTVE